MKYQLAATATLSAILTASCASVHTISLRPRLNIDAGEQGHGRSIAVVVSDERPSAAAGAAGGNGLTLSADFKETVQTAIADALIKQGFTIAQQRGNGIVELQVAIRSLDQTIQPGSWTSAVETVFTAKGACVVGSTRPYEQLYRGANAAMVSPLQGDTTDESANAAVAQALRTMVTDPSMISCLVE